MSDDWKFDKDEVLVDDEGHWWHVLHRYECIDTDDRQYYLEDGTHTGAETVNADDAEGCGSISPLFESTGWSTTTKPAHERGYRVNGMLCEPANVDFWRGSSCVSEYDCEHCGETTEESADIIVNLENRERTAVWIECGACGETTHIAGDEK